MAQSAMPRSRGPTRLIKSPRRGMGHLPDDPACVQVHIAWDDGSTLAILATAGDLFRKLTDHHDPTTG